jgi:hypothetical protein
LLKNQHIHHLRITIKDTPTHMKLVTTSFQWNFDKSARSQSTASKQRKISPSRE